MPAVTLTERDKERLKCAHRRYRRTGEALERYESAGGLLAVEYTDKARTAHDEARESLLGVMFECGVGSFDEVFDADEMAEMLD